LKQKKECKNEDKNENETINNILEPEITDTKEVL
jgi:hypothetical protein